MIYGEIGVTPLIVHIKNRVISYWTRIIENINSDKNTKLVSKIYITIHELQNQHKIKSQWIENVKQYLFSTGYSGVWYSQNFISGKWLIKTTLQKLKDIFIQTWQAEINQTSDTNLYKYIKPTFRRSFYIDKLTTYDCKFLIAFLTRNHRLPIETGRWQNTPPNERICTNCRDIGDEFHYLFKCPIFTNHRRFFIDNYTRPRPNMHKFKTLIQTENVTKLKNLSKSCAKIITYFKQTQ
jgi:hypothetical protein